MPKYAVFDGKVVKANRAGIARMLNLKTFNSRSAARNYAKKTWLDGLWKVLEL